MKTVIFLSVMFIFFNCSAVKTGSNNEDSVSTNKNEITDVITKDYNIDTKSTENSLSDLSTNSDTQSFETTNDQEQKNDTSNDTDTNFDINDVNIDYGKNCTDNCGVGNIKGEACALNEQFFVVGATVWVDAINCHGIPIHMKTLSYGDGSYLFKNVPCGEQIVNIKKGSFSHSYLVKVITGKTTDVSSQGVNQCFEATATKIAVITGDFDNIEYLVQQLGFKPDIYKLYSGGNDDWSSGEAVNLLTDSAKLNSYDILFIDSGAAHDEIVQSNPQITYNIKDFVKKGGSFYASDYAYIYIESAFPEAITFYGEDINASPKIMNGNTSVDSTILDPALIAYFGNKYLKVYYGLGPLVAVKEANYATVHIQGFVKQFNAVQPSVMSYVPYEGGGTVIFTNFHNDEQASQDMMKILYYMIFIL